MSNFYDKSVLITGGASGIGKIMARLTLERGARVIIWDINQAGIKATIEELSPIGEIDGVRLDVSDAGEVNEAVRRLSQPVDILINNAGIVVGKHFHEHTEEDITRTISINTTAPMLVTRALIDSMLERDSGHICNIASAGALLSNPKMSVYAASKWAMVGWSDSLRVEFKQQKRRVRITTVLPYYIRTGMFAGVNSRLPMLEPEPAALSIIRAIEKDKQLVSLPGYMYRTSRLGQALFSVPGFDWLAGRVLGIYRTMDEFTGRTP